MQSCSEAAPGSFLKATNVALSYIVYRIQLIALLKELVSTVKVIHLCLCFTYLNVPAGHGLGTAAPTVQKCPFGHKVGLDVPDSHDFPAGHGEQSLADLPPDFGLYVLFADSAEQQRHSAFIKEELWEANQGTLLKAKLLGLQSSLLEHVGLRLVWKSASCCRFRFVLRHCKSAAFRLTELGRGPHQAWSTQEGKSSPVMRKIPRTQRLHLKLKCLKQLEER